MNRFFTLLAIFVVGITSAQNANIKAKKLLDEVYNKVISYKNIQIDFRYMLDNPKENIKQETRGDVTLEGEKYVINYLGVTQIFDGKNIYTITPENEEITIESATNKKEELYSPSSMLTFYRKGYTYKWDIEQNVKGRKIQYIDLKPTKNDSNIKQILLGIDSMTKHIYNVIQIDKKDVRTTIVVNQIKTNQILPENKFQFDETKYKKEGYYISRF
ncbi:LolA family protein [Capnocytophaga catalasegens]|uniref:Membrane protein n=1 Tax=Capnocytophaga catalasegens TaxID=1004260 RepID=A0AAV5AT52_9FLAO|nr:outer membrane lipoprotein carrier protein LolA [Capnocytophaga catalasegens]GIZ14039.1 membrane protein [Capnocytophaga catalasegens]GJM49036.1 membrane protein [Capnocytophaga catalasegens]GJM52297.1 membrane protein [Capnocytophaga catalasegens]